MSHWLSDLVHAAHTNLGVGTETHATIGRDYLRWRGVPERYWTEMVIGVATEATPVARCPEDFVHFAQYHWTNTLVFPCFGPRGELLGLQTRSLNEKQYHRYDLLENAVYPLAYGGHLAWPKVYEGAPLLLVEGIFDYFAAREAFPEVAVLATVSANVSKTLRRWIARYAQHVIVCFDHDEAGLHGAQVLLAALAGEFKGVVSQVIPQRHDPGEYLQHGDLDGFRRIGRGILDAHARRASTSLHTAATVDDRPPPR